MRIHHLARSNLHMNELEQGFEKKAFQEQARGHCQNHYLETRKAFGFRAKIGFSSSCDMKCCPSVTLRAELLQIMRKMSDMESRGQMLVFLLGVRLTQCACVH